MANQSLYPTARSNIRRGNPHSVRADQTNGDHAARLVPVYCAKRTDRSRDGKRAGDDRMGAQASGTGQTLVSCNSYSFG